MSALLTDEEIRQFVIVFARDWKTRTGKNSCHVRIEFAVAAAAHVLSAQEARLAEDAKVRAGLVATLQNLVSAICKVQDWDGTRVGFALDDVDAALAAAKEME